MVGTTTTTTTTITTAHFLLSSVDFLLAIFISGVDCRPYTSRTVLREEKEQKGKKITRETMDPGYVQIEYNNNNIHIYILYSTLM